MHKAIAITLTLGLCAGCAEGATGSLSVLVEPEDVIIDGLDPGSGVANIRDGWTVRFDKYLMAIGDIDVELSTDHDVEAEAHEIFVVDLKRVPASGLPLWSLEDLREGRWDFSYHASGAAHDATAHDSVEQADFDAMKAEDLTYLIEGVISKSDGRSCPPASLAEPPAGVEPVGDNAGGDACYDNPSIRFIIPARAETRYGPCEIDGVPGFAVTGGQTTTVAVSIHGDHIFFNGFPESDEGGVTRLAQWLADCDLDLDGVVTKAELDAVSPEQLAEIDERYQLGGSPITPLHDMWDFVVAQLKTQGHYQGEGDCAIDGKAHDHDH